MSILWYQKADTLWVSEHYPSVQTLLSHHTHLNRLPTTVTTGPSPLKVKAP